MLLLLITQVLCKTMSLLVNTSKDFLNYRHMSNIQAVYRLLIDSGFPKSNILPIFKDDPNEDTKNIRKGRIYFNDTESIDQVKMEPMDLNEHILLNLLYLKHEKLLDMDENDNMIIYMCGHSREGFIKICDRHFLFKDDLMRAIQYLSNRLNKVLLILDTCQASTLIDTNDIPSNVTVVTSSLQAEFSYSNRSVSSLGVAGIDDFAYEIFRKGIDKKKRVGEYFGEMNDGKLKSTVACWGNKETIIEEFFTENKREIQPFKECRMMKIEIFQQFVSYSRINTYLFKRLSTLTL